MIRSRWRGSESLREPTTLEGSLRESACSVVDVLIDATRLPTDWQALAGQLPSGSGKQSARDRSDASILDHGGDRGGKS